MNSLWKYYVFRRGAETYDVWDSLYDKKEVHLLYIAGYGFDTRAQVVMKAFLASIEGKKIISAELLLVGFSGYELSDDLSAKTIENATELEKMFSKIKNSKTSTIIAKSSNEEDVSSSDALKHTAEEVIHKINGHTDIILDVSSLPRVVYLALMTGILNRLVPDKQIPQALYAKGVNFQILVAEDVILDSKICSDDPNNELIGIPGFTYVRNLVSAKEWPIVWFPILGENRLGQLKRVIDQEIDSTAEICPVLPHPSKDLRRGDNLLKEYKDLLIVHRETPLSNFLYVNEANPFEVYRQLLSAMMSYKESMCILGGCRIYVTPLGSKLMTIGAGLACFEMRPQSNIDAQYGVAFAYTEPKRYIADLNDIISSKPEITLMLLTGEAYKAE